jgi:hypothetical protein
MSNNYPKTQKIVERRPLLVPGGGSATAPGGRRFAVDTEAVIAPGEPGYDEAYRTMQARYTAGIEPVYADTLPGSGGTEE